MRRWDSAMDSPFELEASSEKRPLADVPSSTIGSSWDLLGQLAVRPRTQFGASEPRPRSWGPRSMDVEIRLDLVIHLR